MSNMYLFLFCSDMVTQANAVIKIMKEDLVSHSQNLTHIYFSLVIYDIIIFSDFHWGII